MSITTPSESSSARRNVASTAYVAPCSSGEPERLAAQAVGDHHVIRTVTLYTLYPSPYVIGGRAPGGFRGQPGHDLGQPRRA
jgi:hypothetical protein